ncbi:MAG TPA: hypothetical protein VFA70_03245 [Dehalococcoidia bacterium]|nr:hypothetical protein [Dehalococcoidia bacterium]
MHECNVCHDPIERGTGEPCAVCNRCFHFNIKTYPHAPACGIMSDHFPGLIS